MITALLIVGLLAGLYIAYQSSALMFAACVMGMFINCASLVLIGIAGSIGGGGLAAYCFFRLMS